MSKEDQLEFIENGRLLASKNADLPRFNKKKIDELKTGKGIVESVNEPRGLAGKAPTSKAGGLHNNTLLAEGCKVWRIKEKEKNISLTFFFHSI